MTVRIVAADLPDADALAALHASSWQVAYRGLLPDRFLDMEVVANRHNMWRQRLQTPSPGQLVLEAYANDALCGFACVYLDGDECGAYLDNLHVAPHLTGHGVGAELLTAVRHRVRERSATRPLYLWVLEGNTGARRFYERHGAQPADHRIAELVPGIHVPELRYVWKNP